MLHGITAEHSNPGDRIYPREGGIYGKSLQHRYRVFTPGFVCTRLVAQLMPLTRTTGALVALHRKVHLFDIDIPGKITFKVRRLHHRGELSAII